MAYKVMYGISVTDPEVQTLLKDVDIAKYMLQNDFKEPGFWNIAEAVKKEYPDFSFEWYNSAGAQTYIFGRKYQGQGMDETRKQFEDSVKQTIPKIFHFEAEPDIIVLED
jgi:hypothetical protein